MPEPQVIKLTDPAPGSPLQPDGTPVVTVERAILAAVRQGAYPHVAAAAAGVPADVWKRWTNPRNRRKRPFQRQLAQAVAQARVTAEIAALSSEPLAWLRNGPGRETDGNPGWSAIPKPALVSQTQVNILASPEWNSLWATMLKALSAFPEARAALADALCAFDGNGARLPPLPALPSPAASVEPSGRRDPDTGAQGDRQDKGDGGAGARVGTGGEPANSLRVEVDADTEARTDGD